MASQNQSITLCLNLNSSRAEKAHKDLVKSIMAGEQQLAEMRKKVNGISYADLYPDVEKALEKTLKNQKNLLKRFTGDYADLEAELVHIQTISTSRLKTLLADTQARMDSLNFQKQRKEWMELAKKRGEFEREMKARQEKQAATQSRAQDRIMREIHMSEQEIATMKALQLAYAETSDKEEKALRSIDRINKAKANAVKYTQELTKAQQDLANAQAAAAANPADPTLQANVTNSQDYVNKLLAHPKKMPSALSQANAQNRLALAQQNKAAAEAAYNQFMQQTGAGPIQGSIQKLKSLYQELEQLRNNTADKDKAQQISLELQRIKEHIDAMQTAPLRNLKAVLTDVSNAQSLQQLEKLKNELTSIYHNSTNLKEASRAKRELEDLEVRIKNYGQEYMKLRQIKKVVAEGDQADVKQQELAIKSLERLASLRGTNAATARKYKDMIEQIRQSTKGLAYDEKFVGEQLKNLRTAPFKDLERAAQMVEARMKSLKRNTDEYVKAQSDLSKIKKQLEQVNGTLKTQGDWLMKAITKLANYIGIFGGFYMIRNELQKAFEANIKYDDSLSNIRKTTQMTSEAVEQLADNIKKINSRTSLQDITNLAYAAGRLGVKGASDVMGFVRAADQINIALGEQLNGAESVEQLMKITNLMGVNQEYGLEQALLKTGSAINVLTMESTATAQPMVDFMKRTAGIATQSGVTTAELTGLAGALNALGQNVEMSATSISKVMVQISTNSKKVAQALKMTDEEATDFFYDIKTGHMMDALLTVLEKTRDAGGLSHLGTIVKDLGSEGQRVIQTLATLSSNYDFVVQMVNKSTKAFEAGTSATEEYNLKNANTAALWEKIKNNIAKQWVSPQNIKFIHDLLRNLQHLPEAIDDLAGSFSWIASIVKGFALVLTEATWVVETFVHTLLVRAVSAKILAWSESFAGFNLSVYKSIFSIKGFTAAWKTMNTAMKLNVITAIAGVLLTLYHVITDASRAAKEFEENLSKSLSQAKAQAQAESNAIGQITERLKELNINSIERRDLITELNSKYGTYLENLIEEGASYQQIAEAMEAVNSQLKMKAILDAKVQSEADLRNDMIEDRGNAREKLVQEIMGKMNVEDRSTASQIANTLLNSRGEMFNRKYNARAGVYEYKHSGFDTGAEIENRYRLFKEAFAKVGFDNILLGKGSNDVIDALVKAANVEGRFEARYERIQEVYNADAKNEAAEAQKYYEPATARQWADVSKLVTQNGKLVPDFNEEGSEERVKGYATKLDERYYADERDKLDDAGRKEVIKQLDEYIKMSRQLIEDYKRTDEDAALLEAVNLSNAQKARDIFSYGELENKDIDKDKIKKAKEDNKAAQALYQSIMDNIRDFYKRQEEIIKMQREKGQITATRMEQLLEENEINLLNSQSIAEQRIIGEIDLQSWLDELGEMDARNIAGEAGQYVLNLIKSVTDPRNIGLIFNRTKNAVIQMDSRIGGEREEYKPEDDNMTDEQKEADRKAKKEADEAKMKEEQSKTSSISDEAKSIVARNQKNAVTFMDWAMKQWGLSPEQAAGFAGVLMEESRIDPSNYNRAEKAGTFTASAANGPDAYGAGIAQWSNLKDKSRTRIIDTRKDKIISILQKQTGKNFTEVEKYSLEEQMAAMAEEISSRYPGLIELLKQQADSTGAADIILRGFENGGGGNLASVEQIDKYTWNAGWSDKEQTNPIKGHAGSLYGVWKQGKNGNMMYIPGRAELGASILGAYNGEDLSSFIVGDTTRTLGAGASRVAAEGNAFDANLRLSSDKKQAQITSLRIKQQERLAKLWLEDNPFGEIADKYQAELERMGVMLNDLIAENNDELVELQKNVMSAYLKIGKNVFEYDMDTSEGVERFRDYISQFPELAEKAQMTTVEELQAIYYKSYAFAQEYSEKIAKTFDKNRKLWENMFKKTDEYVNNKELQQTISMLETGDLHTREDGKEVISLGSKRATRYGGSERIAMKQDVVQKSLALNNAKAKWDNNILMAEQQVAAAEQIQDPDERERALQAANEQLELAKQRPDEVTNAINALIASMGTLKDATYEWAESMVSAFEKVADGFVPLREFYDDKGSFAQNVFGTKEEREQAFSEFIGDLKRSLRKALAEKAKEKTQEAVLNAVASRKELMQKAKDSLIQKGFAESELKHKQIVEEAKTIAAQKSQMEQNTISSAGTSIRQGNDTKEATTGMWGNFGKAISAAWADGGPFAGAVLAALVGATLSALMTMVFNMMGKSKGGGDTSVNTKLVSGMLTYDAGNVQSFAVRAYDDGVMPVMADNGKVYMAQPAGQLGTGMVTRPTLTTIGGMPALVGEEGPEMVIGRETTRALQMNNPEILRIIQAYDVRHSRGYAKAYDSGNVSEVMGAPGAGTANESAAQMQQTLMMLNNTLAELQQKGIHATINKYGRGGLVDEVASGIEEVRRVGSSNRVNRLFR